MIKHTLLFILTLVSFTLLSQEFQWVRSVPVDFDAGPSALVTAGIVGADGNLLFTGFHTATQQANGDVFLQRIDTDGNMLDEVTIYGEGRPPSEMVTDSDNNIYFYMRYQENMHWQGDTIKTYTSGVNIALVKIDAAFNLLWVQYQQDIPTNSNTLSLVIKDDILYTGFSKSWDTTMIRLLDMNGNVLNEIYQKGVHVVSSVAVDDGGNIYATGSCANTDADFNGTLLPPPEDFSYNTYLVKYNSGGMVQWVKYLLDVTCITPRVVTTDEDHVYLSGVLNIENDFDDIHLDGPAWVYDFFVARLNSQGDFLWAHEVPQITTGDASVAAVTAGEYPFMAADAENNVYLTGFIRGDINWGNGIITESTNNYYDVFVWSYDAEGEMQFAVSAGGTDYDKGLSIIIGNAGEVYISGIGTGDALFGDIEVSEADRFSFITRLGYDPTGIEQKALHDEVKLYPNPATDHFMVETNHDVIITLTDMTGKRILQRSFTAAETKKLDISDLVPGIYIYHVSGNGKITTGKMIKE